MMEHPIHLHGLWSELEDGHGQLAYNGKFGETAHFTRNERGTVNDVRFIFGIRLWY